MRLVRNETQRRLPASRNVGAREARGAWLAFLDDDDLWSPRKLRAQLDTAQATGAAWVYAQCIVVDADMRPIDVHPFPDPESLPSLLLGGNHVPGGGSNVIVRADTFREVGPFDESLRFFEDWDLWLRLVDVTLPAACPELLVARVEHGSNMLFRDRADVRADFERLRAKHGEVTDDERLAVAEWIAHEHMRAGLNLRASALYARAAIAHRSPGNAVAAVGALFGRRGLAAHVARAPEGQGGDASRRGCCCGAASSARLARRVSARRQSYVTLGLLRLVSDRAATARAADAPIAATMPPIHRGAPASDQVVWNESSYGTNHVPAV